MGRNERVQSWDGRKQEIGVSTVRGAQGTKERVQWKRAETIAADERL